MTVRIEMPASSFKAIANLIQPLATEIKMVLTPSGIEMKAVDAAHVAMIDMKIASSSMPVYEVSDEEDVGLDLTKVKSILSLAGKDENIALEVGDRLTFRIGNITRNMSMLDTATMTTPKMPDLTLVAHAALQSADLQRAIRAVTGIGADFATLSIADGKFTISTQADTQDAEMEFTSETGCTIDAQEPAKSGFPLDYISSMIPAIPSEFNVNVGLSNDYPVVISFVDGGIEGRYLIAPRVESDGASE